MALFAATHCSYHNHLCSQFTIHSTSTYPPTPPESLGWLELYGGKTWHGHLFPSSGGLLPGKPCHRIPGRDPVAETGRGRCSSLTCPLDLGKLRGKNQVLGCPWAEEGTRISSFRARGSWTRREAVEGASHVRSLGKRTRKEREKAWQVSSLILAPPKLGREGKWPGAAPAKPPLAWAFSSRLLLF